MSTMDEASVNTRKRQVEHAEKCYLLKIFPEEVWLHIFDKIWDPEVLIRLTHASCLWRKLLDTRRTEYLFPQILEILTASGHIYFEEPLSLLEYRLVCKIWRAAVNGHLENGPDFDNPQFYKFGNVLGSHIGDALPFNILSLANCQLAEMAIGISTELYERDLLQYSHSLSNIFPSRRLSFDNYLFGRFSSHFPMTEDMRKCCAELRSFAKHTLNIAGHHFWHARFQLNEFSCVQSWYNEIRQHVSLLPNLHSLDISRDDIESRALTSKLNGSFPTINSLEMFTMSRPPNYVLKAILHANPHIKVVILTNVKSLNSESFNFAALSSLHTLSVSFSCLEVMEDFQLPKLLGLKILRLGFLHAPRDFALGTIFNKLELYRETLTQLFLDVPPIADTPSRRSIVEDIWKTSRISLNLPNVKIFEFRTAQFCTLDFLLGLYSLECLRMRIWDGEMRTWLVNSESVHEIRSGFLSETTIIDFKYTSPDFSRNCNIWQLIPSLEYVELDKATNSCWVGRQMDSRTYRRQQM